MSLFDFMQSDPSAVTPPTAQTPRMGLFGNAGPLSGSQKTAILFAGLRDALGSVRGQQTDYLSAELQRADQQRRQWAYQNTIGKLTAPPSLADVNVTPQMQPGGAPPDPNSSAYQQPFKTPGGPLAENPMADILKSLPADQGIPMLSSLIGPHKIDTVTDAQGVPHLIDSLTGQDRGTIGGQKPLTFDPSKINLIPNNMMGPSGNSQSSQPQSGPLNARKFFTDFVAPHEGSGLVTDTNGAPVKYGINQAYWPGENVKGMTADRAGQIFNKSYFQNTAAANLPAPLAAAYSDTAFMAGQKAADSILQNSGGDVNKFLQGRQTYLNNLIASNPAKYGPYAKAWEQRTSDLQNYISNGAPTGNQNNAAPSDNGNLPNLPGYTTIAPKPQWRTITDPAEAKALNVNVGSQINTSTNEVKPLSAYNMPASAEDPSIKMYGAILATTGHLPTGAGRDASSMRAYRTAAYNYLKSQGLSDEQIAQKIPANAIGYKAQGSAASTMAKTNAATAVNEGTVNNSINIVRTLLPFAASKGSFTDVNSFMQALGRKTNDPNAVMLKNGIDSISAEYARVMTGATNGTASSDASRKEAADRILTGYNNGTLNAVMNQMQLEMAGRSGSQSSVLKNLSNGSYSGVPVPYSPKKPPPLSPVSPSNLPRKAAPLKIGRFSVQVTGQ